MTIPLREIIRNMERRVILRELERQGGHREQTADILGIPIRTLNYKLKKYRMSGVEIPESTVKRRGSDEQVS